VLGLQRRCPVSSIGVRFFSWPAPIPTKEEPTLRWCPDELTPEERAELDELLPDPVTAHHLKWLENGEGAPWPESSG
jgi:hypothetical protein